MFHLFLLLLLLSLFSGFSFHVLTYYYVKGLDREQSQAVNGVEKLFYFGDGGFITHGFCLVGCREWTS